MTTKEDAREERKLKFIESLKRAQTRDLIEPLKGKIESFLEGKLAPEDLFKAVHYVAVQSEKVTKRFRNRPDVVLAEIAMDENKFTTEIHDMNIKARHGDITALFVDAIVSPADPRGVMEAGLAAAIKRAGGEKIEKEATPQAPLVPGHAIATGAGTLSNLRVIHVATGDAPGGPSSPERVRLAAAAALELAEKLGMESVAIPGLGTGIGKVSPDDAAAAIVEAVVAHSPKNITDITLIDRDEGMALAFARRLEQLDEE